MGGQGIGSERQFERLKGKQYLNLEMQVVVQLGKSSNVANRAQRLINLEIPVLV